MQYWKVSKGAMFVFASMTVALLISACGGGEPEERRFSLSIAGRTTVGETTFEVKQGDTVVLDVATDEDGELHLHGYDVEWDVHANVLNLATFVADTTGQFAMEMHVEVDQGGTDPHDPHEEGEHAQDGPHHEPTLEFHAGVVRVLPR